MREVIGDNDVVINQHVENACQTIIIRKNDNEPTTFGLTLRGSMVETFFQYAEDNDQVLTENLKTFMKKCGSYKGSRISYDSRSFIDKNIVYFAMFARQLSDMYYLDRFDFTPWADAENVAQYGAVKFAYDLSQDRFVGIKAYQGDSGDGDVEEANLEFVELDEDSKLHDISVNTYNYIFSIDENENLSLIDTQLCSHYRTSLPLSDPKMDQYYVSRFENEMVGVSSIATEFLNDETNRFGYYFAFAERASRNQGYFYVTSFSRPVPAASKNSLDDLFPKTSS